MKHLALILMLLAAASLACGPTINVNVPRVTTGPTETLTIGEPSPGGETITDVTLRMGAGRFTLGGGAEGLIDGTIQYNVPEWKPIVTRGDGRLTIEQGNQGAINGVPDDATINDWNLRLGTVPINLSIEAGAYKGKLALGGLALRSLSIADGASSSDVTFDTPNAGEMSTFTYSSGASSVTLTGLANANFATMSFKGGAGDYTLDFSGTLQRNASVTIDAGVSSLVIVVPKGASATVTVEGAVNSVHLDGSWAQSGQSYTLAGSGKTLTIAVTAGVGSVRLVEK
jgi:hypothetical protein